VIWALVQYQDVIQTLLIISGVALLGYVLYQAFKLDKEPRERIFALSYDLPTQRLVKEIAARGFSRVPIYQKSLDNVRGILNAKDLVRTAAGQQLGRPLVELLHEPLFVPRATPVKRLFLTFKQKKVHMALVVSEYGKVLGIVTMDDLLSQIFGVLRDERAEMQNLPNPRGVKTPAIGTPSGDPTGPLVVDPDTGPVLRPSSRHLGDDFGAVVDDMTMRVSLVARGRDHMINTPPQILLYQAFGATVPAFAHLPMMLAASGEKLSKRHGAVSVTEYRDAGYSPDAVLDYLARFGWSTGEHEVRLSRSELVAAFDWAQCGRGDGKFDAKKFLAIDHEHLKSPHLTSDDVYLARVRPFIAARGLVARDDELRRALPAIRERAQTFVQAADLLDPLLRELPVVDPAAARKFLVAETAPVLRELADVLARVEPWTVATLEAAVTTWLRETGREMKTVGQPARVALTGRTASPSLYDVLALIGRDRARARLAAAAELSG